MFNFNIVFVKPIEYKANTYWFDPTVPVPVSPEHEDYGKTFQILHSLTNEDCLIINTQAKWQQIREYRNSELQKSDWTQGADVPDVIKTPWSQYRTLLRNLPQDFENPDDVILPTKPE